MIVVEESENALCMDCKKLGKTRDHDTLEIPVFLRGLCSKSSGPARRSVGFVCTKLDLRSVNARINLLRLAPSWDFPSWKSVEPRERLFFCGFAQSTFPKCSSGGKCYHISGFGTAWTRFLWSIIAYDRCRVSSEAIKSARKFYEVLWTVVDWWKINCRPKGCLHCYWGWFLSVVYDDLKLSLDYAILRPCLVSSPKL